MHRAPNNLRMHANIIIEPKTKAIRTASEASAARADHRHRFFFCGSTSTRGLRHRRPDGSVTPGSHVAGFAYASRLSNQHNGGDDDWKDKGHSEGPSAKGPKHMLYAGNFSTLAAAHAMAAMEIAIHCKSQRLPRNAHGRLTIPVKVTIFTDSKDAMKKFGELTSSRERLRMLNETLANLLRESYLLYWLGVEVDVRWCPSGRCEGSKRAITAAKQNKSRHPLLSRRELAFPNTRFWWRRPVQPRPVTGAS